MHLTVQIITIIILFLWAIGHISESNDRKDGEYHFFMGLFILIVAISNIIWG